MEHNSTLAILTLALLTAPALAGGVAATIDDTSSAWLPTGRLTAVEPHAFPSSSPTDFGESVAVDGDTAIVGAPHLSEVHVYERTAAAWTPAEVLKGPKSFGTSLAMDGDTIVAGAPEASAALVFEASDSDWELSSTLTVPETECLGSSTAVGNEITAVGDPCGSTSVYVFEPTSGGWEQVETLTVETDDRFGRSVDLSDSTLLVGGDAAHAFDRALDGTWSSPTLVSENAGLQVALSGDLAATGSVGEIPVFQRTDGSWSEVVRLRPHDVSPVSVGNERFSFALDLAEETLVVSAAKDDSSPGFPHLPGVGPSECVWLFVAGTCVPPQPGAAYVFEEIDGEWTQVAKLAPEQASGEDFSSSVAIDEEAGTILAGAPGHAKALGGFVDIQDAVYTFSRAPSEGAP